MKWLLLALCCPLLSIAQNNGRQDDTLRKIADTMHFAKPFVFTYTGNSQLSQKKLYNKCFNWVLSVKDSLTAIEAVKDPSFRKLVVTNVPATPDITCNILITINGSRYTCSLQQYIFHGINGKILPVEKAALQKDYRETVNIERVIISRNHQQIFDALNRFLGTRK